jgi:WD40 repeat protein/serine/threonine protein kinase
MSSDSKRVQAVFLAAVEQPAAERIALLERECGADAELRRRVEALLQAHDQPGSLLEAPAADLVATVDEPIAERPGTVLGPYKLLQEIGEGGMGTVFMAEQTQPLQRKVALKIIKPGMDSRPVIARFEAERQALALMDHPHIARVLDAGTTDSGRPYFVMELVKGVPITRYCDEHRLTLRQRMELFVPVCQAVQHAHQKGIIHRDLKPSNILVAEYDDKPVAKVIDFGVAKATGPKLTDRTMFTEFGQIVGTLEYMSPEQAKLNALDIDTRSDTYALGVVLYELFTGTTPFDRKRLQKAAFDEMLRIIREEEPPKPSTRLSTTDKLPSIAANRSLEPRKLSGVVRGELDWIVMKCLEKDRNRRYDTASSLALDVLRYLHEEPVLARSPGTSYRLRKFVRRHPASLALAVISLVAVLALVAFGVGQFYNARLASTNAQLVTTSEQLDEALQAAKAEKAKARHYLYVSQMTLADRARQEGQIGRMMQLLRSAIPESLEEEDLRGFEWYHLWRQYHGEQSRLRGHTGPVTAVAFSPDGRLLASASVDASVKLWNASTGKVAHSLTGQLSSVTCIAFSPDSNRVASGSVDHTVKLWDVLTGHELGTLHGHEGPVNCVAFCPKTRKIASGSEDKTVRIWDADSRQLLFTFSRHNRPVSGIAFHPDGGIAVSTSRDRQANWGEVIIWNPHTGHVINVPDGGDPYTSVTMSPDGSRFATSRVGLDNGEDNQSPIHVFDLKTGDRLMTLHSSHQVITQVTFSPDGKRLASSSTAQLVKVWDLVTAQEITTYYDEAASLGVSFSPDGLRLAAAGDDTTVKIWTPSGKPEVTLAPIKRPITNVAFSPDGQRLAAACFGKILIWDVASGKERLSLDKCGRWCRIAWSPDGTYIAMGPEDQIWNSITGQVSAVHLDTAGIEGGDTAVRGIGAAFSPDGSLFAAVWDGSTVGLWEAKTGARIHTVRTDLPYLLSVALSRDGRHLAVGSCTRIGWGPLLHLSIAIWPKHTLAMCASARLQILDVMTAREVLTIEDYQEGITSLAYSPDGSRIAAAFSDLEVDGDVPGIPGSVRVWDVATGHQLYKLRGHPAKVYGLGFSPNGKRLASAGGSDEKGEVKIWDMTTGQEVATLAGFKRAVYGVSFSPNGTQLASGCIDGTVTIWNGAP